MSGPRAAVRIAVTADHLEQGWLSRPALREIRHLLADVPAGALVYVDLGPLRHVDDGLARTLALLPCADQLRIESSNWRVAHETALVLVTLLVPDEAMQSG